MYCIMAQAPAIRAPGLFADIEVCGGVLRVSGWGCLWPFIVADSDNGSDGVAVEEVVPCERVREGG